MTTPSYKRKLRRYRWANSLCIDCGAPSPDFCRCADCRQVAVAKQAVRRQKRRAEGKCAQCAAPSNKYLCAKCYGKYRAG